MASATPPVGRRDGATPARRLERRLRHQGARRQPLGGIVDHGDQRLPRVGYQGQPVMPAAVRMHAAPQPPAPRATRRAPVIKERERSRPVREAYLLCFNSQSMTSRGSGSSLPWGGGPSEGRAGCGGCGRAGSGGRALLDLQPLPRRPALVPVLLTTHGRMASGVQGGWATWKRPRPSWRLRLRSVVATRVSHGGGGEARS
jgi:hypothetical protein